LLTLHMPDGHMGFPGALDVQAKYEIDGATLRLEITAQADKETLCSFASHGYWNLSGEASIDAHTLKIDAPRYLPVDDNMIPLGAPENVSDSAFDFTEAKQIAGAELDHNFCVSDEAMPMRPILWLSSDKSGVQMEIATTEAGVQIYDGRSMEDTPRGGLAIEPQAWPDAANQIGYPNTVLKAGETYSATSEFRFSKV